MVTNVLRSVARDVRSTLSLNRALEFNTLVDLMELGPSHDLLDVGTGDGYWAVRFAERAGTVVGLDPSDDLLSLARELHPRANLRYDKGAAERLPYKDESFDRVVSVSTAEHFQDPEKAIREMARTLRKGGVLAMSVDCLSDGNSSTEFRTWHAARHFVTTYFSTDDLIGILRRANLEPDEATISGIFTSRLAAGAREVFIRRPQIWAWAFPAFWAICRLGDKLGLGGRIPAQIVSIRARKPADNERP
jgi:ubiquinone/menaquinone biosynthesis C-methylase UbiE